MGAVARGARGGDEVGAAWAGRRGEVTGYRVARRKEK